VTALTFSGDRIPADPVQASIAAARALPKELVQMSEKKWNEDDKVAKERDLHHD
jgi:hypothetical protein